MNRLIGGVAPPTTTPQTWQSRTFDTARMITLITAGYLRVLVLFGSLLVVDGFTPESPAAGQHTSLAPVALASSTTERVSDPTGP